MSELTEWQIAFLLRCHVTPSCAMDVAEESIAESLRARELLETAPGRVWQVTERGSVYALAIRDLPLPERRWVMPESKS